MRKKRGEESEEKIKRINKNITKGREKDRRRNEKKKGWKREE